MTSPFRRIFSAHGLLAMTLCVTGASAHAQLNASPYDSGAYGQSPQYPQQYPQQTAPAKPSIAGALGALGIGRRADQPNQTVRLVRAYGQANALWMVEPSDTSMSALLGRWTGQQNRSVHWQVPFDPQVGNYNQINQELGLQNAATLGQAVERVIQSYNRRADMDSKIAACLYSEGPVAAVVFPMGHPQRC